MVVVWLEFATYAVAVLSHGALFPLRVFPPHSTLPTTLSLSLSGATLISNPHLNPHLEAIRESMSEAREHGH